MAPTTTHIYGSGSGRPPSAGRRDVMHQLNPQSTAAERAPVRGRRRLRHQGQVGQNSKLPLPNPGTSVVRSDAWPAFFSRSDNCLQGIWQLPKKDSVPLAASHCPAVVDYSTYLEPGLVNENILDRSCNGYLLASDAQNLSEYDKLDYLSLDLSHTNKPSSRSRSTTSSSTYSPPSIASQVSSSASNLLSPVQTEHPADWLTVASSSWSRGPSPLRQVSGSTSKQTESDECGSTPSMADKEKLLCLGPSCNKAFADEHELKSHVQAVHTHTCNWAACGQPSFSTKEGLIAHVKAEHLLICPVVGCPDAAVSFQSKKLLGSHVRVAHSDGPITITKENMHKMTPQQPAIATESSPISGQRTVAAPDTPTGNPKAAINDRAVRNFLSVLATKKRCKEQLRTVIEKKRKKANGISPCCLPLPKHHCF
jgi:hypothetical protein